MNLTTNGGAGGWDWDTHNRTRATGYARALPVLMKTWLNVEKVAIARNSLAMLSHDEVPILPLH
jgi:hypothetical protein